MKSKSLMFALSGMAALVLAGTAVADSLQHQEIQRLTEAKERLVTGEQAVKPSQAAHMRSDADELQKMIDQARAGQRLDPEAVDRAIDRSYTSY